MNRAFLLYVAVLGSQSFKLFIVLTFSISWGVPGWGLLLALIFPTFPFSLEMYSPFYYVAVWGPAIAALILIYWHHGWVGLGSFLAKILDWRLGWKWWLFAVLWIPIMYLAGAIIERYLLQNPEALGWYQGTALTFLSAFAMRATAGPIEEIGWRAFALPLLQQRVKPWEALIILATIHTLWHVPAFMVSFASDTHFATGMSFWLAVARFALNIFSITVFMNIAYNATGGKLSIAFLIHWMLNGIYPWEGGADTMTGQVMVTGLVAVIMLWLLGPKWLTSEHAATNLLDR